MVNLSSSLCFAQVAYLTDINTSVFQEKLLQLNVKNFSVSFNYIFSLPAQPFLANIAQFLQ